MEKGREEDKKEIKEKGNYHKIEEIEKEEKERGWKVIEKKRKLLKDGRKWKRKEKRGMEGGNKRKGNY